MNVRHVASLAAYNLLFGYVTKSPFVGAGAVLAFWAVFIAPVYIGGYSLASAQIAVVLSVAASLVGATYAHISKSPFHFHFGFDRSAPSSTFAAMLYLSLVAIAGGAIGVSQSALILGGAFEYGWYVGLLIVGIIAFIAILAVYFTNNANGGSTKTLILALLSILVIGGTEIAWHVAYMGSWAKWGVAVLTIAISLVLFILAAVAYRYGLNSYPENRTPLSSVDNESASVWWILVLWGFISIGYLIIGIWYEAATFETGYVAVLGTHLVLAIIFAAVLLWMARIFVAPVAANDKPLLAESEAHAVTGTAATLRQRNGFDF